MSIALDIPGKIFMGARYNNAKDFLKPGPVSVALLFLWEMKNGHAGSQGVIGMDKMVATEFSLMPQP